MGSRKKFAKILFSRELRKKSTKAERVLWKYLKDRKFFNKKFRRQHIIEGFIVDFYCPEEKLAIELDGSIHYKQKDYDRMRQDVIEDAGVNVLRFKNKDVLNNIIKVLKSIKKHITLPSPLKMERDLNQKAKVDQKPGEE